MFRQKFEAPHASVFALRVFKILKMGEELFEGIRYLLFYNFCKINDFYEKQRKNNQKKLVYALAL